MQGQKVLDPSKFSFGVKSNQGDGVSLELGMRICGLATTISRCASGLCLLKMVYPQLGPLPKNPSSCLGKDCLVPLKDRAEVKRNNQEAAAGWHPCGFNVAAAWILTEPQWVRWWRRKKNRRKKMGRGRSFPRSSPFLGSHCPCLPSDTNSLYSVESII